MLTDSVADMLTRIRNANKMKSETVEMSSSKEKVGIAKILVKEGYISSFKQEGDVKKTLTISLKYLENGDRILTNLKRISKPGLRIYANHDELPRVLNGYGIAIVSTSKGLLTDVEARKAGIGGEVLAYVW
jgi:small subunit ribosomal protein S8